MKTIISIFLSLILLIFLGSAKVLIRTNPVLGFSILAGCGLMVALCWFIYPKIKNRPYKTKKNSSDDIQIKM